MSEEATRASMQAELQKFREMEQQITAAATATDEDDDGSAPGLRKQIVDLVQELGERLSSFSSIGSSSSRKTR